MKKQIRRRKAIALVLCLFMMFSITPLSYADEVMDVPAADVSVDSGSSVESVESAPDSIVEDIFDSETPTTDSDNILGSETDSDAIVDTPTDSELAPQEPQYDENGNLIVPEEGTEEGDGEPVEEVTEGEVPGAVCTIEGCQCPCHEELTDESMAEGMEVGKCTIDDCACPCHPQQEVKECTCGAEEGQPHQQGCPLYVEVSEEILELYEKLMALETQEDVDAFVAKLTDEQLNALCEYILKLQEPVVIETVNFTEAGPFMPPVTVETSWPKKLMSKAKGIMAAPMALSDEPAPLADSGRKDVNELKTRKWVEKNDDGSFKITLEAYTTGTVTTKESTIPVDIVLVLDQSGSMQKDFNGDSCFEGPWYNQKYNELKSRQYAMKTAVNAFIDSVGVKYSTDANHRIAIVTFGDDAKVLQTLEEVNASGANTLKGDINGLPAQPTGATNVAAGMAMAQGLLGDYTGTRQQVVIVFTDGVPTTNSAFDMEVANNALVAAETIKNKGATIYSVGIFNGANPNQTYGEKWSYLFYDIPCSGQPDSYWGGSWVASLAGKKNDFEAGDIVPANRFLNFLSSKAAGATEMGITAGNYNPGIGLSGEGWRIDNNPTNYDSSKGYYLTAADASTLNTIFHSISEQISTTSVDLGANAVVKDIVTPYFNMPENARAIRVKTAAFNGSTFEDADDAAGVTPSIDPITNTVSVTGFSFKDNFVSENPKPGTNDFGKKLIIEFDVTPKDGFLGGNNVPTNGSDSGVYDADNAVVEEFEVPHVNVPIPDVTVTAQEKNVYLLGTLDQDQLMDGVTVKLGDAPAEGATDDRIELNLSAENYGLQSWQNAFVNIDITKPAGISTGMTGDTPYTVTATVKPKEAAAFTSVGTANNMAGKSGADTANINVFKPEVTYKDTDVWYGDTVPNSAALDACRNTPVAWKHGDTVANPANMIGDEPTLSYIYELPQAAVDSGNKIATKKDIPVQATVKIGTTDVTTNTSIKHENCEEKPCNVPERAHFLLHNNTCSLTLTKTGTTDGESFLFKVKKDNAEYMSVSLTEGQSVIINELPVGTYSVSEETGWAWRYSPSWSATTTATFTANGEHNATLICTNAKNNNKWLSANAEAVNVKGQSTQNGTVNKTEASTTSHGTMAVENMNYPVPQPAANPEAAVAYVLDVIKSTNNDMKEGDLNA